jgi:hypothetical protein
MHVRPAACLILMATLSCSRASEPAVARPSISIGGPATAGRAVDVTYRFAVNPGAPPMDDDYMVFVHAFDTRGARVWTADHELPSPVRAWKAGSIVEYVQPVTVPGNVAPGRVTLQLGLYSPRTRARLPLSGEDAGRRSYVVGSMDVAPSIDPPAIFVDGWHGLEAPAPDVQWHWSTASAAIWLRNPGRDAVFVLEHDQPMLALPAPQHVTVRIGGADVSTLTVAPGQRDVTRIPVTASQLGSDPMVIVTLAIDRTFVPASVPEVASGDTRELGVRVFGAYFEAS